MQNQSGFTSPGERDNVRAYMPFFAPVWTGVAAAERSGTSRFADAMSDWDRHVEMRHGHPPHAMAGRPDGIRGHRGISGFRLALG
jgi:hypothetical protein